MSLLIRQFDSSNDADRDSFVFTLYSNWIDALALSANSLIFTNKTIISYFLILFSTILIDTAPLILLRLFIIPNVATGPRRLLQYTKVTSTYFFVVYGRYCLLLCHSFYQCIYSHRNYCKLLLLLSGLLLLVLSLNDFYNLNFSSLFIGKA